MGEDVAMEAAGVLRGRNAAREFTSIHTKPAHRKEEWRNEGRNLRM